MYKHKLFITSLVSIFLLAIILTGISASPKGSAAGDMGTFSSYEEMESFIKKQHSMARMFGYYIYKPS